MSDLCNKDIVVWIIYNGEFLYVHKKFGLVLNIGCKLKEDFSNSTGRTEIRR